MLIINAKIRTMAGKEYQNGYIQIKDREIVSLGNMQNCPTEADYFDAAGAYALPGFIDAHCHIGMWEDGLGFEGDDGNEDSDPCTPHLRGLDGVNPFDRSFEEAVDAGVTTVITGPGSANPIAGQLCAMKTYGHRADTMVIRAPAAIKMAFGENPKNTYHEKDTGPVTRMGIAAMIREQLAKSQRYEQQLEDAQKDEDLDEPDYDAKCEALLPLLRGEIQAHIHAHRADDIFTALRIAKEFSFSCVIVHGTEGHLIAEELAEEHIPVITGPLIGARTKPELAHANTEGPALLCQAGVKLAISTDHPEVPCYYLLLSAQLAVQAGMKKEAALRAITIDAAEICGISDRVGSLESGKDADIVLFEEDPMVTREKPLAVFINGKKVRG